MYIKREMISPRHFHNTFITNLMWWVVFGCHWWSKKSNFNYGFKLEPITIYHLHFGLNDHNSYACFLSTAYDIILALLVYNYIFYCKVGL